MTSTRTITGRSKKGHMSTEYDVVFEVRVNKRLTPSEKDRIRDAMLRALDAAPLPFNADVVTAEVLEI